MWIACRVLLLGLLALPAAAAAHGPCGCLTPSSGPPGTRVTAEYPVYKVVFNPDRTDLGIGPEGLWDRHRPGAPVTVLRRTWEFSELPLDPGAAFTIPRARPGRYLIALYDGGEGGAHYSWASFRVTAGGAGPVRAETDRRGVPPALVAGVGVAALAVGFGLGRHQRFRRRHPDRDGRHQSR